MKLCLYDQSAHPVLFGHWFVSMRITFDLLNIKDSTAYLIVNPVLSGTL
jgi:hypothetical protein